MIFKILAIAVVLFLVYMVFFKKGRVQNKDESKASENEQITDTLVECPKCGTFFSKDEGILSNGKYFCSKECLSS
jgi:uncharacterized protein